MVMVLQNEILESPQMWAYYEKVIRLIEIWELVFEKQTIINHNFKLQSHLILMCFNL